MCFSAPASFVASGGLAVVGVATFRQANKKQKMLAAIPFLFAIQQALEGFQWISLCSGETNYIAAYGFLFFALLFWPLYAPITVFMLDNKERYKLKWLIGVGVFVSTYFLVSLIFLPLRVSVLERSIDYQLYPPSGIIMAVLYVIAVCGSFMVSSKQALRWFGVALFASAVLAGIFFTATLTSVWCFFAAILSSLIYLYIKNN